MRPFPNAQTARWQISRAGGFEPVWAHNGRELFYRNAAFDLVAAEVAITPSFQWWTKKSLLRYRMERR